LKYFVPSTRPASLAHCLLTAFVAAGASVCAAQSPSDAGLRLFSNHVRPLFDQHCSACHKPDSKQGGLDLASRDTLLAGGSRGPAIIPGDAQSSLLYRVLTHAAEPKMPFQGDKLSPEAIGLVATWIDLGAPYAEAPKVTQSAAGLFEEVRPILETKCLVCHGGKFKQAGLDISTRENLIKGSDEHKDVVIAGDADGSLLMKKVRQEHDPGMPYQSDKLPQEHCAEAPNRQR
jgi:mono/diheme cytochrome c family protein